MSPVKLMVIMFAIGFLAGLMLMGLMRLYDRLPEKKGDLLRALTLLPPIFLAVVGLVFSIFVPLALPGLVIAGLVGLCGWRLTSSGERARPKPLPAAALPPPASGAMRRLAAAFFTKKTIGGALVTSAVTPYVLIGLTFIIVSMAMTFESRTYSFKIHNYGGHEIIVKEARVGKETVFKGEQRLAGRQAFSHGKEMPLQVEAKRRVKPGKIKLLVYDTKLENETWQQVDLPVSDYPGQYPCPFDIVYDQGGFKYERKGCG